MSKYPKHATYYRGLKIISYRSDTKFHVFISHNDSDKEISFSVEPSKDRSAKEIENVRWIQASSVIEHFEEYMSGKLLSELDGVLHSQNLLINGLLVTIWSDLLRND